MTPKLQSLPQNDPNPTNNNNTSGMDTLFSHLNFSRFSTMANFTQHFSGRRDENIMDWFARFERFATLQNFSDKQKFMLIVTHTIA